MTPGKGKIQSLFFSNNIPISFDFMLTVSVPRQREIAASTGSGMPHSDEDLVSEMLRWMQPRV